jgi:peptidase A4-like protein
MTDGHDAGDPGSEREDTGISSIVTPPEFDITTALDEELDRYGLPRRPDSQEAPEAFAAWRNAFRPGFHLIDPELRTTARKHGPIQVARDGDATSNTWSGAVIVPQSSFFTRVTAQWQVVYVWPGNGPAGVTQCLSSWVGIDGAGSGDVLQAGVEQDFVMSAGDEIYYPWFEWYPNPETQIANLAVRPGDTVTCFITANGPFPSTNANVLFSVNGNSGVNINLSAPGKTQLQGNCAEWIAERPTITSPIGGDQVAPLPEFAQVVFSQIAAQVNGQTTTFNLATNVTAISMLDGATVLAVPHITNASTLAIAPPAPVKTHEKGKDKEKDHEKGPHVHENIPLGPALEDGDPVSSGTQNTFIPPGDRPLET